MKITINPGRVFRILNYTALIVSLMSIGVMFSKFYTGHGQLMGWGPMLDTGGDANLPKFFSTSVLLSCSILIAFIAGAKKDEGDAYARHWAGLSIVFLYLTVDDSCRVHHIAGDTLAYFLKGSFLVSDGWVIPAVILTLIFAAAYLKFLAHLPARTRKLFIISAAMFVGAAAGLETMGGIWRNVHGTSNVSYYAESNIEEFLENIGINLFLYSLLLYIRDYMKGMRFHFAPDKSASGTIPG